NTCVTTRVCRYRFLPNQSGIGSPALLLVLVGTLHPKEGLDVDHVAWTQIRQIRFDRAGELEKAAVGCPVWFRPVVKIESVLRRRGASDHWLEEDVGLGLRDETKHRHERPRQDARLSARQCSDHIA